MLSLISVFLAVVLAILFVRLLPALVAIVTIVSLDDDLLHLFFDGFLCHKSRFFSVVVKTCLRLMTMPDDATKLIKCAKYHSRAGNVAPSLPRSTGLLLFFLENRTVVFSLSLPRQLATQSYSA